MEKSEVYSGLRSEKIELELWIKVCCWSVAQSRPTLCNPMGIYLYPMDKDISSVQSLSCA